MLSLILNLIVYWFGTQPVDSGYKVCSDGSKTYELLVIVLELTSRARLLMYICMIAFPVALDTPTL